MSRWLLNSALILLPAAGLLTYQAYPILKQWQQAQQDAKQPLIAQQLIVQQNQPEPHPAVEVLPYPEFGELRPYQKQDNNRADTTVSTANSRAVSAQVTAESPPSDFLQELDLSELSPELSLLVQEALTAEESATNSITPDAPMDKLVEHTRKYQGRLPAMNLQMHMYATDSNRRWVKINGRELSEGEWLGSDVQLVKIAQRHIVIRFNGQLIEIPQMYEWRG